MTAPLEPEIDVPPITQEIIDMATATEAAIGGMDGISLLGLSTAAWVAGYKAGVRGGTGRSHLEQGLIEAGKATSLEVTLEGD